MAAPEQQIAWFVKKDGEQLGPFSDTKLKELVAAKQVALTDLIWYEGLPEWTQAKDVEGLFLSNSDSLTLSESTGTEGNYQDPSPVSGDSQSQEKSNSVDLPPLLQSSPSTLMPNLERTPGTSSQKLVSSSAASLSRTIPATLFQSLVQAGLAVELEFYWVRLDNSRILETNVATKPMNSAMSLIRRATETLTNAVESSDIHKQRYLIDQGDGRLFVTSQFGTSGNFWVIPREQYSLVINWQMSAIEATLYAKDASIPVQSVGFVINVKKPYSSLCSVSPNTLLTTMNGLPQAASGAKRLSFPLLLYFSKAQTESLLHPVSVDGTVVIGEISETGMRFFSNKVEHTFAWSSVITCLARPNQLDMYLRTADGVQRIVLTTDGGVTVNDELVASGTSDGREALGSETATDIATEPLSRIGAVNQINKSLCLPESSLREIVEYLVIRCPDSRCHANHYVAEIAGEPLFGTKFPSAFVSIRDGDIKVSSSSTDHVLCEAHSWSAFTFDGEKFLRLGNDAAYRISLPTDNESIWQSICSRSNSEFASDLSNGVVVSLAEEVDQVVKTTIWLFRLIANGRFELFNDWSLRDKSLPHEPNALLVEIPSTAVESYAIFWSESFARVRLTEQPNSRGGVMTMPTPSLIELWKHKELSSLQHRTASVPLGALYDEFNKTRCEKHLAGIFGHFFLVQQRVNQDCTIADLISRIEASPPGALPAETETILVQKLSILEVSRHQLNRWLDRCSLLYPHLRASSERKWLSEIFEDSLPDTTFIDREAWRTHQQVRGELRQVQASMGRCLGELGQNLNNLSFAFPEEVRCAALAATRRAASMADQGAMIATFGGIGAQLLVGVGRATIGDPLGFAMVGALGLSLVGKHLQKQAKDTEQRIRLRAYGVQAL